MRILYLGPCLSDYALRSKRATSPAAAKWSNGFLCALCKSAEVYVLTHCDETIFPYSKVVWQGANSSLFEDAGASIKPFGYINLPILKNYCLSWQYRMAVRSICTKMKIDVLLCYNLALRPFYKAAIHEARRNGVKCVPIILDGYDPRIDDWHSILRDTENVDGLVFLSRWMSDNFPTKVPRLHMDGGIDFFKGREETVCQSQRKPFRIVHIGGLDALRGGDFLKEVLSKCGRDDVKFILCGKCANHLDAKVFSEDKRIELKGFVSEPELAKICESATAFISVSDPKNGQNAINFPSKLLQYLSWGVPIVSTWLESYSSEYLSILKSRCVTADEFISRLNDVLRYSVTDRKANFLDTKIWVEQNRIWSSQIDRLLNFLQDINKR